MQLHFTIRLFSYLSIAVYRSADFASYSSNHIYTRRSRRVFFDSAYGKMIKTLEPFELVETKFDFLKVLNQLLMWGVTGITVPVYIMVKAFQQLQNQVINQLNIFVLKHLYQVISYKIYSIEHLVFALSFCTGS